MPIRFSQQFEALAIHDEVVENNKNPFLHPDTDAKPLELPPRTSSAEYLRISTQNIRAEYAAFLEKVDPAPLRVCLTVNNDDGGDDGDDNDNEKFQITEINKLHSGSADPPEKLKPFNRHLFCIGHDDTFKLCIVRCTSKADEPESVQYTTGAKWPKEYNHYDKHKVRVGEHLAYDFGYIGDFEDEFFACQDATTKLESGCPPQLLEAVADPTKRRVYTRTVNLLPPSPTACPPSPPPPTASAVNVPINASQTTIIDNLAHQIECIQGPPGTGKSTTIFHIIQRHLEGNQVALVTCVQNKAVDAVAEKLANNLAFFVYGHEDRLSLIAKMWTLKAQVERNGDVVVATAHVELMHSRWAAAAAIVREKETQALHSEARTRARARRAMELFPPTKRDFQELRDRHAANDPWRRFWVRYLTQRYPTMYKVRSVLHAILTTAKAVLAMTRRRAQAQILTNARAVLCTVASTGSMVRWCERNCDGMHDGTRVSERICTVILDEAGTTPECKLPILLQLPIDRIIAIGDQKQLAPFTHIEATHRNSKIKYCHDYQERRCHYFRCKFVHKTKPKQIPKALGFFQRVEEALPRGAVPMLTLQYRMHPNIANTVSDLFYDDLLATPDDVAIARRKVDAQGMWCLDVHGAEVFPSERNKSCTNPDEIEKVYQTYLLLKENHPTKSIMIITFYKAQQRDMVKAFKEQGEVESPTLRITTVDQSQGSEADSVLLSTVRCNNKYNIGFVQNENRMNVAISRARERLVVIGDRNTFLQNHNWKKIWAACEPFPLAPLPAHR